MEYREVVCLCGTDNSSNSESSLEIISISFLYQKFMNEFEDEIRKVKEGVVPKVLGRFADFV